MMYEHAQGLALQKKIVSSPFPKCKCHVPCAGSEHALLLTASGAVFGCGNNAECQCGLSESSSVTGATRVIESGIVDIASGNHHNLCLSLNGELFVFGKNHNFELGVENSNLGASAVLGCAFFSERGIAVAHISAGSWHSIVMDDQGVCWGFGSANHGRLGFKSSSGALPTKIEIPKHTVRGISCGGWHSALLTEANEVFRFGFNGTKACSVRCAQEEVYPPYHVGRDEIGIDAECVISRVIAGYQSTLIVVEE